jgi:hypothetical protein
MATDPRTIQDLTNDPQRDDEMLRATRGRRAAFRDMLRDRQVPPSRLAAVESAYARWAAATGEHGTAEERATRGALGFWLMTMLMLSWVGRDTEERTGPLTGAWLECKDRLDALLHDRDVRRRFNDLYSPPQHLDLATASVHRIGTTSFILRCEKDDNTRDPIALKCLLYPYTAYTQIVQATEKYRTSFAPKEMNAKRHMPRVYDSSAFWIEMDFIEGDTLEEVLGARSPVAGLDLLDRYGPALLAAVRDVPVAHMDLSPSNIILSPRPSEDGFRVEVQVVLVDFGENYLLTQDVGAGHLSGWLVRFVAPELLHSRSRGEPTGYEDLFSIGQILLALAGSTDGDGGFIPTWLYAEAPLVAELIEDLIDHRPDRRLLLLDGGRMPACLDAARRSEIIEELLHRFREALELRSSLKPVASLAAMRSESPQGRWQRLSSAPSLLLAPARLTGLADLGSLAAEWRQIDGPERWLRGSLAVCKVSAGVFFGLVGYRVAGDLLNGAPPQWQDFVLGGPAYFVMIYHSFRAGTLGGWQRALDGATLLTFGAAAVRYYLAIFANLTTQRMRWTRGRRAVEIAMRGIVLGPLALTFELLQFQYWMLLTAAFMVVVVLNNYLCWNLARRLAAAGREAFSTIRSSDLVADVERFSEWWKQMLGYVFVLTLVGLLSVQHVARDLVLWDLVAMAANVLKLFMSNCGKLAPGTRANLRRAFVTGQRLEALEARMRQNPAGSPAQTVLTSEPATR